MDLQEILRRYAQLAGLTEEEAAAYTGLCGWARDDIAARLLRSPEGQGEEGVLNAAAAALAYYRNCLSLAARSEDMKAGDLSVTTDRQAVAACAFSLWKEAEAQAALLLDDRGGFAFCGVLL